MKRYFFAGIKILVLILVLPLFAVFFSSPSNVSAACSSNPLGSIIVNKGLVTAIDVSNINLSTASGTVYCINEQVASIPQFSIQNYDEMKTNYFDQAKSTFNKITISGDQTQSADDTPINLLSL